MVRNVVRAAAPAFRRRSSDDRKTIVDLRFEGRAKAAKRADVNSAESTVSLGANGGVVDSFPLPSYRAAELINPINR